MELHLLLADSQCRWEDLKKMKPVTFLMFAGYRNFCFCLKLTGNTDLDKLEEKRKTKNFLKIVKKLFLLGQ